ncbi:MAG: exodeoxyribonuclease III [Clostridiales bacterium]|nr:exodeoxyribonuclease III [Clostridiales bacterium]
MKLRLVSWNVNGVRAAVKKGAMESLNILNADIVCLQELKARPEQVPQELTAWPSYTPYVFSAERPGYSGVAVFTRLSAGAVQYGLNILRYDCEGRSILLDLPEFKLFNCYFPNGGQGPERLQYKMDFYEDVLKWAAREEKPLVICGDVNTAHREIDLARPKESEKHTGFLPMEREWIDRLLDAGFIDTFRMFHKDGGHYSWWDMKTRARERDVGWRIDYFFVSEALMPHVRDAYILPEVMGSDHCPVVLELEF